MRRSLFLVGALVPFLTLSLSAGPARAQTGPASQSTGRAAPADGQPTPRPRRTGLLIGGLATLGISYTLSAAAGIAALESGSGGTLCNTNNGTCVGTSSPEGRALLIPVVGPWLAMRNIREVPILAFLGIAQATGVALTIAGIVRYSADGADARALGETAGARRAQSLPSGFISFGVLPTRDGAFGFLSGRI
jgi:hypothetical protein